MKYNLIMISGLLSITCLSHAVKVKMPSADVLVERLKEEGLIDFAQVSKISQQFANRELQAVGIATSITAYVEEYIEGENGRNYTDKNAQMLLLQFNVARNSIYRAIFKDYPEALKELEELKLYKPTEK